MLTLTSDAGQTWHLTDEQASNFATLVTLPPDVLASLVDLARAQAKLDAATGVRGRSSLRVVDDRGAIVHQFNCRNGRLHATRGEPVPVCRWMKDSAGGYACAECGTWAKPDSERARVLCGTLPTTRSGEDRGRLAVMPVVQSGTPIPISRDSIVVLANARAASTGERRGQALFNVLTTVLPDLAEKIRGTDRDPFYADSFMEPDDDRVSRALAAIDEHLASEVTP